MDIPPNIEDISRFMRDIQARLDHVAGKKLQRAQTIYQKLQSVSEDKYETIFDAIESLISSTTPKEVSKNSPEAKSELSKIIT